MGSSSAEKAPGDLGGQWVEPADALAAVKVNNTLGLCQQKHNLLIEWSDYPPVLHTC